MMHIMVNISAPYEYIHNTGATVCSYVNMLESAAHVRHQKCG